MKDLQAYINQFYPMGWFVPLGSKEKHMDSMDYECLLRRVYKSGRNYSNGADADIYRKMERAYRSLEMPQIRTREDAEYEYRSAFASVRSHVSKALSEGMKQIGYRAGEDEVKQLEAMIGKLTFDFYDKATLDEIIDQADDLFHKYGLQGR